MPRYKNKYVNGHPPDKEPSAHYYHCGCHCSGCTEAAREYQRDYRNKLKREGREPQEHGTWSAYNNFGCRCDECVSAAKEYRAAQKAKSPTNVFAKALEKEK